MKTVSLSITKGARQFGYIIWNRKANDQLKELLSGTQSVYLYFDGSDLGEKRVDWKYYRISVGWRWTRRLGPEISTFVLTYKNNKKLEVKCK